MNSAPENGALWDQAENERLAGRDHFASSRNTLQHVPERDKSPRYSPGANGLCGHAELVLLKLDCGAGGIQFRLHCSTCWQAGPAIPHERVQQSKAVQGDRELIDAARSAAYRRRGSAR